MMVYATAKREIRPFESEKTTLELNIYRDLEKP